MNVKLPLQTVSDHSVSRSTVLRLLVVVPYQEENSMKEVRKVLQLSQPTMLVRYIAGAIYSWCDM